MKYIFNKINEHIASAFESVIPQVFSSTRGIKNWDLSGYASILPRNKFSVTV